jgi:hypothetical protein
LIEIKIRTIGVFSEFTEKFQTPAEFSCQNDFDPWRYASGMTDRMDLMFLLICKI